MKQVARFQSFDGQVFETEAACRAYETANTHKLLVGLSAEEIDRAIAGDQDDLAEALEAVGARIARARRERGDLKRRRAPKDAPAEAQPPVVDGIHRDGGVAVHNTTAGNPTPTHYANSDAEG